jgi:uncharacterized protein (DUF362 family)
MSCRKKGYGLSRRQFMSTIGAGAAGMLLNACSKSSNPVTANVLGKGAVNPLPVNPAGNPAVPGDFLAKVAVAPADSYNRTTIKEAVQDMFEALGGISDIVKSGDKVGIKINLTGGLVDNISNVSKPPYELYLTHPEIVRAVGELLLDTGASKIYILESAYNDVDWDYIDPNSGLSYTSVASGLGAEIRNLNYKTPYADYVVLPVNDHFIYETLTFNGTLSPDEIDCFVSIPKAKNHFGAGVTHGMKNLVGTLPVPSGLYNNGASNRAAIHSHTEIDGDNDNNLVRVILDINRARPINLVVNDAIMTTLKGEGPWNVRNPRVNYTQIKFNKLFASKDPVAADTIAVQQINGYDANAETLPEPLSGSVINYLKVAEQKGVGINTLANIEVIDTTGTTEIRERRLAS